MSDCVISSTVQPVVTFPDGESVPVSDGAAFATVAPFSTQDEVDNFVRLNWLMRPPFSDLEIQLMPVSEIIALYYSLRKVVNICHYQADPVISAGLPTGGSPDAGIAHELNLQDKIRQLRPELLSVSDGTHVYRVLLDPAMLNAPPCPSTSGLPYVLTGLSVILSIIPVVGWALAAGLSVYQAGSEIANAQSAMTAINASQSLTAEVMSGINLAKSTIPNPQPAQAQKLALASAYQSWLSDVQTANSMAWTVNTGAVHLCDPAVGLLGGDLSTLATYVARWKPYSDFFYSATVKAMMQSAAAAATSSLAGKAGPALVGAGIGALLLLL